jgi:LacI family transcriptional regulator
MTIGVIIPDLTNPIFPPMVRGIENYLAPRGYTALVANSDGRESLERASFESLLARRVDGFILGTGHTDDPLLASAAERDVKVVLINRGTAGSNFPLVTGDDAAGISAAVDHLASLGHRRVLHLAGPQDFTTSFVRADAFAAAAERRRIRHATTWLPALSIEAGRDAMDEVLRDRRSNWTAVVASNDLVALGVMRSLRAHGLSCPGDLSVVGFNDMPFAADFSPPLTTVNVPHLQMGAECARLLLDGIAAGAQSAGTTTLPVSLIVRESTAPPRA